VDAVAFLPGLAGNLRAMLATTRVRLTTLSRYRGQLVVDIVIPIVFAAMPVLLGRAAGGAEAAANFASHTGTQNYFAYMLIGSNVFIIVANAFWNIAYWLRWEQETGTLEALYLAPTSRLWLVAGVALYSAARSIVSASVAYLIGSWIFRINPFQGDVLLALLFILVGLVPLFGMTLLFGAVVLKVRESNALIGLMQWAVSLLMGVFFPIAVFPPLVRALALLFPPTWMVNGVRSALLGVGYLFGTWYRDLAILWAFMLLSPLVGYRVFTRVERGIRRHEGVGQF
jgi:ABC-2 type transport system permease protein